MFKWVPSPGFRTSLWIRRFDGHSHGRIRTSLDLTFIASDRGSRLDNFLLERCADVESPQLPRPAELNEQRKPTGLIREANILSHEANF